MNKMCIIFLISLSIVFAQNTQLKNPDITIYPESPSISGFDIGAHCDSIKTICIAPVKIDPPDTSSIYLPGYGNTNYCPKFWYSNVDSSAIEAIIIALIKQRSLLHEPLQSYTWVDRMQLKTIFDEKKMDIEGLTTEDLSEFRKIYHVDCFLSFTLHFLRSYTIVKHNEQDYRFWRTATIPEVEVSLKVISTKTSEILWSCTRDLRGTPIYFQTPNQSKLYS